MKNRLFLLLVLAYCTAASGQVGYNVDALPTNVGGKSELKRIFEQELIYPESALKNKVGGKVVITFVVNKDSTVNNVKIESSVAPDIDAEALRIFRLCQWLPPVKEGRAISGNWSCTFSFEPERYNKICKARGFTKPVYLQENVDTSAVICRNPDQIPMYPQGSFALQDFIKENLEYPRQAQLSNIQGTVVLRFVVEPTGLVTNVGIERSVGGGCDQEALRVLHMIKWYPAKKNDQLVRAQLSYPFYFILNDEFKDNTAGEQK